MPPIRIAASGLVPVGFQVMTLSNSTAVAVNSTCRAANVLYISVETNSVRMRADGTAPTLTTGVMFFVDNTYELNGYNGTASLKFQRSTGTAKVSIQAWRHNKRSL
jgi:hypothetical protein